MLEDYFSIVDGKSPARHWFSSRIPAGTSSLQDRSEAELWELHDSAMARFRDVWSTRSAPSPTDQPTLLQLKESLARHMLRRCRMCERRCEVNRVEGELGYCGVGEVSRLASDFMHFGEESELVPSHTIFFAGCTFRCEYCQNWDIAMSAKSGRRVTPSQIADSLRQGIEQGSRNANFVGGNPDPNLHTILEAIVLLGEDGKQLPMVWNSNMYTSQEAMRLLEGVMDVYLADFRYGNDACAREYSDVDNYFEVVSRNFSIADGQGEIMLRQLLLPGHLDCCTEPIMRWISDNMPDTYFNLMFQYRPEYRAGLHPEIDRRPTLEERDKAVRLARRYGIAIS